MANRVWYEASDLRELYLLVHSYFRRCRNNLSEKRRNRSRHCVLTPLGVVGVVATDQKGQTIRDLQAQDFRIFENGRPQRISNFTAHHASENVLLNTTELSPNVVSNAPQFQASSLNVNFV